MAKPHYVIVWVDAAPGQDVIQLGAVLFDRFLVEECGAYGAYVRPREPASVTPELMASIGITSVDELYKRMMYWENFRDTWRGFEKWLVLQTHSKTFAEASQSVTWTGYKIAQIMRDLADSARRNEVPFFADGLPECVSLETVVRYYETALAYVGFKQEVGSTLEEICTYCDIKYPDLPDAMRRSVVVGRTLHHFLKLQKRAYEKALARS